MANREKAEIRFFEYDLRQAIVKSEEYLSKVVRFRFDSTGTFIGAVINQGKNITIIDSRYRNILVNLYRGLSTAKITRIDFSRCCNYATVTSDHNTVHFYDLTE